MRLLQYDDVGNYSLTSDLAAEDIPPYAILSHTWGPDEVVFADLAHPQDRWKHKTGFDKIRFCAEQAKRHGLRYFWVDTCCIDKSDAIEHQTAINSMFRWYRDSKRCYVYLTDVSTPTKGKQPAVLWNGALRKSRWFTRGWTLQELIAPASVEFYSREGLYLGNKRSLEAQICDITGIPARALRGTPLSNFTITERKGWVGNRQTKYEEDLVYSLLGIFHVNMPLVYGEGRENAWKRLEEEVRKAVKGFQYNNFSVTFSLSDAPEIQQFVAREKELAEMREKLMSDGSRRTVVLHGLGGIGKTQTAVAYAKRYRDEYSAIFWLNIKDKVSIQQSFTKVARQISKQHHNTSYPSAVDLQQNDEKVNEAVKAWLSLPGNTRWLLIFDNLDNPRTTNSNDDTGIDIQRFLPEAYQGSVIITTRSLEVDLGFLVRMRKLESVNDSLEILSNTSGRGNLKNDMDALSLAEKLDGLPLALATAGAYLKHVSIGFDDYLRLYQESWASLHTSTPTLGSYQDRTLCSTWQLSYEEIQKQNPLAAHILIWWAYFDNNDIWFELLRPTDGDHPAWMDELNNELSFNAAMGMLNNYGLVEPHTLTANVAGSRGFSIHACVHAWVNNVLNQDWNLDLARLAVDSVALQVPSEDIDQFWLIQRRLLPHAIRSYIIIENGFYDGASAFHKLGILFQNQGKLQQAEDIYQRALRGYEKAWGPDHTSTLDTVYNLGILYKNQGKLQQAEDMYQRALRGKEKAWGPNHISTLNIVNNLGNLYANQGKLQQAEDMYQRALRGKEKAWGPDYTSTLDTVNNLGILYANQGKLQQAEDMYQRALRGYKKAWGPNYISTLNTVNNLGILYKNQGKLQQAEDMYQRALRGYEKAWGPDHTSTLDTVNNLGILYADQGKLQQAEDMYQRALRGYEKAWGSQNIMEHWSAINTMYNLGALRSLQGNPAEAKALYTRAHEGLQALLGPAHPDVKAMEIVLMGLNKSVQDATQSTEIKERRRNTVKRVFHTIFQPQSRK